MLHVADDYIIFSDWKNKMSDENKNNGSFADRLSNAFSKAAGFAGLALSLIHI